VAGFKLVASDPKTGKTYQKEFGVDVLRKIKGKDIGDELDGGVFELPGYKLVITGGSDKSGFPMRKGVHGARRPKVLLSGGVGYNPKEPVRRRKKVRGEQVEEDIVQLNTKITKAGQRPLAELLGVEAKDEGGENTEGEATKEAKDESTPVKEESAPAKEDAPAEAKDDAPKE